MLEKFKSDLTEGKEKGVIPLLTESLTGWAENDAFLHASSLAYYTIFSIAPLVIISVGIAGMFFTKAAVEGLVVKAIEGIVGTEVATLIQDIILNASTSTSTTSLLATILGLMILLYGASIVFFRLQVSLNAMLGIVPKTNDVRANALTTARKGLLAAGAVVIVGLYLMALLIINALLAALPLELLQQFLPQADKTAPLISIVVAPFLIMIPFALIYKGMPQALIKWRDIWPGALLVAVLFWIGSNIIGIYLYRSGFTSIYGAAGSLVALLIWVFYSALVFLYGAKFIQVYAKMYGTPIIPTEDAMFETEMVKQQP